MNSLQLFKLLGSSTIGKKLLKLCSPTEPFALDLRQWTFHMFTDTRVRKQQHIALGFSDIPFAVNTEPWEMFGFPPELSKEDMVCWISASLSLSPSAHPLPSSSSSFWNISASFQSQKFLLQLKKPLYEWIYGNAESIRHITGKTTSSSYLTHKQKCKIALEIPKVRKKWKNMLIYF